MHLSYSLAVQQFTSYNRDAKLQQMPYVYISNMLLVLQSSWWGRESWLLCLICLPGVSWWLGGSSSRCHGVVCSLWLCYFLIILTYYFGNEPLYYFGIWCLNSSFNIRFSQFQKNSFMKGYKCFMSLKFGLQVLLESCYIIFMKEIRGSLWDKCNFVLIYSRNAFFAPIYGPQNEISNNVVCATTKGSDQPAHMRSLIRVFTSRLTIVFGVSKLKRGPQRLVWVYPCQNATLLEISCRGSNVFVGLCWCCSKKLNFDLLTPSTGSWGRRGGG